MDTDLNENTKTKKESQEKPNFIWHGVTVDGNKIRCSFTVFDVLYFQ